MNLNDIPDEELLSEATRLETEPLQAMISNMPILKQDPKFVTPTNQIQFIKDDESDGSDIDENMKKAEFDEKLFQFDKELSAISSGSSTASESFDLSKEIFELNDLKNNLLALNQESKDDTANFSIWEFEQNLKILEEENRQLKKRNENIYNSYSNELELKKQHVEMIKKLKEENSRLKLETSECLKRENELKLQLDDRQETGANTQLVHEYENLLNIKKNQQNELLVQLQALNKSNREIKSKLDKRNLKFKKFVGEHRTLICNYKNLIKILNEKNSLRVATLNNKLKYKSVEFLKKKISNERILQEELENVNKNFKYKELYSDLKKEHRKLKRKFEFFLTKYNQLLKEDSVKFNEKFKRVRKSDGLYDRKKKIKINADLMRVTKSERVDRRKMRRPQPKTRVDSNKKPKKLGNEFDNLMMGSSDKSTPSNTKREKHGRNFVFGSQSSIDTSDNMKLLQNLQNELQLDRKNLKDRREKIENDKEDFIFISKLIPRTKAKDYKIRKDGKENRRDNEAYYRVVTTKTDKQK